MQNDLTALTASELGQAIRQSRKDGDKALRMQIEAELDRRLQAERDAAPVERVSVPVGTGKVVGSRVPKWVAEGDAADREAYRRQLEEQRESARLRRQSRREFTGVNLKKV